MPDERGVELLAARDPRRRRTGRRGRAGDARPAAAARRGRARAARAGRPLVLDPATAPSHGRRDALLAPFLEKGSSVAIVPIAMPGELLATLTIVSLDPVARSRASSPRPRCRSPARPRSRSTTRASTRSRRRSPTRCSARSCRASAPRAAGPRARRRLRVVGARRRRRRRLRLPDARGRAPGGRARRRDGARRRRHRRHGDGEVRLPLARPRASRAGRRSSPPRTTSSRREIAPGKFITMVEVVIDAERGEVACASAGHPQPRLVLPDGTVERDPRARPRARHRRAAGVRGRERGVPAGRDGRPLHGRRHRGAARRRAVRRRASRPLLAERAGARRRGDRRGALAACRAWADGELADDCAVVVIKRRSAEGDA